MDSALAKITKLMTETSRVQVRHKEWHFKGKWLRAGCMHYSSQTGQERVWETVERTTTSTTTGVDGADIIALSENHNAIHLVAVYRPSVKSVSIEIPGGLIDKDETIEEAALRELGEETGQSGVIECVDFVTHSDPWKSTESSVGCVVTTTADKKCEDSLKKDEDECIESFELPMNNLLSNLSEIKRVFGSSVVIESKLYMLAKGIQLGQLSSNTL